MRFSTNFETGAPIRWTSCGSGRGQPIKSGWRIGLWPPNRRTSGRFVAIPWLWRTAAQYPHAARRQACGLPGAMGAIAGLFGRLPTPARPKRGRSPFASYSRHRCGANTFAVGAERQLDPGIDARSVSAFGLHPGHRMIPQSVTGTGDDELAAVRDLDARLRGHPRPLTTRPAGRPSNAGCAWPSPSGAEEMVGALRRISRER